MKHIFIVAELIVIAGLYGCGTPPHFKTDTIQPSYISPLRYKDHNCNQLADEITRLERRLNELDVTLGETYAHETRLNYLKVEYARLKGELSAIEKTIINKECKRK